MKKHLLMCLTLLILPMAAWANPTDQGNFVVTVPILGYSQGSGDLYEDANGDEITKFDLAIGTYELGVQYFIVPNVAVGGVIGYSDTDQGDESVTTMAIGPMASFYIPTGNIMPYIGIGYLYTDSDYESYDLTLTSLMLKAGIASSVGKYLAIYGEFSFTHDEAETDYYDEDGATLNLAFGLKAFF